MTLTNILIKKRPSSLSACLMTSGVNLMLKGIFFAREFPLSTRRHEIKSKSVASTRLLTVDFDLFLLDACSERIVDQSPGWEKESPMLWYTAVRDCL